MRCGWSLLVLLSRRLVMIVLLFGVGSVGEIDRKLDPLTTVVNGYIHFAVYYIPAPTNSFNYLIFVPAELI